MKANLGFYFKPKHIFNFLLRKDKTAQWALLPKGWMKSPKEIYEVMKLGLILSTNYFVALLPHHIGYFLYRIITGKTLEMRSGETDKKNPDAIDGTMRIIKFDNEKNRKKMAEIERIQNPLNDEHFITKKQKNLSYQ